MFVYTVECPFCSAEGENAAADCDRNIKYMACRNVNSICGVLKRVAGFRRGCIIRKRVNSFLELCRVRLSNGKKCKRTMAGCDKPRCKAEFPGKE